MKFTKEDAIEKLNQVLTNSGKKPLRMSARTLEGQTETLMSFIADDEMELDAFVEKVTPSLASINSNMEHDQSEFIRKYEDEHKPIQQTKQDIPDDPTAALIKRLEELERANAERTERAAIDVKRSEIRKYLEDNNVKDKNWIDSMFNLVSIGKDDDVEEKGKTYLEFYNKTLQGGGGITPLTPTPGGEVTAESFDDVKAIRKRRAEISK